MELGHNPSYAFLSGNAEQRTFQILPNGRDGLGNWAPVSRMSPVFPVRHFRGGVDYTSPSEFHFEGQWHVIFAGPVHPEEFSPLQSFDGEFWLTLGLYNVLLACEDAEKIQLARDWCADNKRQCEIWTIEDGQVLHVQVFDDSFVQESNEELAKLWSLEAPHELTEAIREFVPLAAAAIARGQASGIGLDQDLRYLPNVFGKIVEAGRGPNQKYIALGRLLTINAGLSRFSSQTFAGISPIFSTECHFWLHSLFGIGVANIALRNIRDFMHRTLGEAEIHKRFKKLELDTSGIDLSSATPEIKDYLGEVDIDAPGEAIPLLAFFSARDGYRSTEVTVSAPLAAVSSCNSVRWSLLTLTHEFCHVIVRAVQSDLYPDFSSEQQIMDCVALLESDGPAENLLKEIRRSLLMSVCQMENHLAGKAANDGIEITAESVRIMLQRWRQEVDEIIVHVFDYLYFYGQDSERYIIGIWSSWGTIPNIRYRVKEYVVRSVCAVLSRHLMRGSDALDEARTEVLKHLQALAQSDPGSRYVRDAVDYLQNKWDSEARDAVLVRRNLVKLARIFLFSEELATKLRSEPEISTGRGDQLGYTYKRRDLDRKSLRNPLLFLANYTNQSPPSQVDSLWVLYILAFCYHTDE